MAEADRDNRIVWIDMEMTGLDVKSDQILEIACLITDADLNILAEGPDLVIHHSDAVLDGMNDEWCKLQHGESGLTEAVRTSSLSLQEAENEVLKFVQEHTPRGCCPLGGNSVYTDRFFLKLHMPELEDYLHYRIVDVSTVKELCRRWYPTVWKAAPEKTKTHRALNDIKESIEELQYYRRMIFQPVHVLTQ